MMGNAGYNEGTMLLVLYAGIIDTQQEKRTNCDC